MKTDIELFMGSSTKSRVPNFNFVTGPKYYPEGRIQSAEYDSIPKFQLLTKYYIFNLPFKVSLPRGDIINNLN